MGLFCTDIFITPPPQFQFSIISLVKDPLFDISNLPVILLSLWDFLSAPLFLFFYILFYTIKSFCVNRIMYQALIGFIAFYKLELWNITCFYSFLTSNSRDRWPLMTCRGITHLFILNSTAMQSRG